MKNSKGITLMALVITIIVLLILAGITIGALTGNNGIIKQAQTAKTNTERSDIEEQINVMVVESMKRTGNVEKDVLLEKLDTLPKGKEIIDSDDKIYVIYPEYDFEIDIGSGDVITMEDVEKVQDETPWELAGSGTKTDPYLIESIEDLVAFSNGVNQESSNYSMKYIKLVNNLDFNSPFSYDNPKTKVSEQTNRIITEDSNGTEIKTFLTTGTGFNPIGKQGENSSYRIAFDGNGKEIKNIYINRPEEKMVALFSGSIGQNWPGVECRNVGVSGNIIGNDYVAGIVASKGKVENSYNKANILGKAKVGGIGGYSISAKNCYNSGNVKILAQASGGSDYAVGGIVGDVQSNEIRNCYNFGKIELEEGYCIGRYRGMCWYDL